MQKAAVILAVLALGAGVWQLASTAEGTNVISSSAPGDVRRGDEVGPLSPSLAMEQLDLRPLAFTKNAGQWDERVLFRANAGGATMWFTKGGVYYQFTRRLPTAKAAVDAVFSGAASRLRPERFDHERNSIETMMIKATFVGANVNPTVIGLAEMEYKCNYFIGNDPNEWHTDVPNYEYVLYEDVYPGIDLKYYGKGSQVEYDFIVSPSADPSQIVIRYEGAKSLAVSEAGELEVETGWSTVTEQAPYVYQETAAGRREVLGKYRLTESNTFGFGLETEYDSSLPLIIDPTLVYSTYLGGDMDDSGQGIAVDDSGNAYVTGGTCSSDFPTENPYQTLQGACDAFVTKLSSSGNSLIYSTYLGGGDIDWGWRIAVDGSGNAYVTGGTRSSDFPTQNPYQTYQDLADVFVTKLSSSGNSLIYSTYLGGGDEDYGEGIAVDGSGNAYVTGLAYSSDFPTESPYQTCQGNADVFVTKLSISGSSLIYSTYLGGGDWEHGNGIAVDASGNAFVTGLTLSSDFPTENPYQTYQGGYDAFMTKLSISGSSLVYSTYLGGGSFEDGNGITVDDSGNAYVTGTTYSSNFPTENPYQTDQGDGDVFVTKLNSSGSSLVYSTYLGGNDDDEGYDLAVDGSGNAYVTGNTFSWDFPRKNPYHTYQGNGDVLVTKLSSSGNSLIYSTCLGGGGEDYGEGIAVDGSGNAYVTGTTYSSNFPTENPYQTDQGLGDAFVTELSPYVCGDADGNGIVNISDAVYLITYVFGGGPPPNPLLSGDVDCNEIVNISDAVYLINYIFGGGPEPCAGCP